MAGRPLRGAPLSEATIVAAALRLARDTGLESVRMRDLAEDLDVAVGALYHHVSSQAVLQGAVVSHVLAAIPAPSELPGTPRQRLTDYVNILQETLQDNPGLTASVIAAAPDTEIGRRLRREIRGCFREAGLSQADAEKAFLAFEWLWLGSRITTGPHSYDKKTFDAAVKALLDGLLGPEKRSRR